MSLRVLARPLAAATLAAALVLTPALATADPGNGKGGDQDNGTGQEAAPGQQKDKSKDDKSQDDEEQGGGTETAPGQQKDKSKDDKSQGGGTETAPGQQKDKSKDDEGGDKGPQGPKPGKGGGSDNAGGAGDPAGNNGTVKIAALGDLDSIPNNTPHPGCTFQVEWYGFDEGEDVVSTVTFEAWSPTRDVVIGGTSPSQVFVGGDPASGAGTETGLDGRQAYALTFDGEPHPKQGYHVKLTVQTPYSQGNDTKSKVFWVAPCDEETTTGGVGGTTEDECTEEMTDDSTEGECATEEECTEEMTEGTTEGSEDSTEEECVAGGTTEDTTGTQDGSEQNGVLGTQLAAVTAPVQNFAGLLTGRDSGGDTAAVPTSVDAGADGGLSALTDSPWPLVALLAGLLAGLGALVVRRRAGA